MSLNSGVFHYEAQPTHKSACPLLNVARVKTTVVSAGICTLATGI